MYVRHAECPRRGEARRRDDQDPPGRAYGRDGGAHKRDATTNTPTAAVDTVCQDETHGERLRRPRSQGRPDRRPHGSATWCERGGRPGVAQRLATTAKPQLHISSRRGGGTGVRVRVSDTLAGNEGRAAEDPLTGRHVSRRVGPARGGRKARCRARRVSTPTQLHPSALPIGARAEQRERRQGYHHDRQLASRTRPWRDGSRALRAADELDTTIEVMDMDTYGQSETRPEYSTDEHAHRAKNVARAYKTGLRSWIRADVRTA